MNVFDAGNLENSLVLVMILMREDGKTWREIEETVAKARIRVEWSEKSRPINVVGSV